MGEFDDGEDDGAACSVVFHVGDEALVDLDDVDREPFEVGQGAVAGSEVVEGESDPEMLELAEHAEGVFAVLGEDAFGDLEDDLFGVGVGVGEHGCDGGGVVE